MTHLLVMLAFCAYARVLLRFFVVSLACNCFCCCVRTGRLLRCSTLAALSCCCVIAVVAGARVIVLLLLLRRDAWRLQLLLRCKTLVALCCCCCIRLLLRSLHSNETNNAAAIAALERDEQRSRAAA